MSLSDYQKYFQDQQGRILEEWKEFLRFPSISSLTEHALDCLNCANWLAQHIKEIGFSEVRIIQTSGQPVIYAHFAGKPGAKKILYYGHYDVYQINPFDVWKYGAFEPTIEKGRMYARGAQDNKGQTFYFLKALECLIAQGKLDCAVTLLIEGEEETTTSAGLMQILPDLAEELKTDVLMVCDTDAESSKCGSIVLGLRGIIHLSFRLEGLKKDLHSGAHGGLAPNPAQAMAKLLATLHTADGSIAVADFYQDVAGISNFEKSLLKEKNFDTARYLADTGVEPVGGEQKYSAIERRGFRPTLEINGVYAGYIKAGVKTIIPAYSNAKLTARLVAGQDPDKCLENIENHLKKNTPKGLRLKIEEKGSGGAGVRMSPRAAEINLASKVLRELYGETPSYFWEGASVPVVARLINESKSTAVLVGFGLEEDRVHASDESFSIEQFEKGFCYACCMLEAMQASA